MKLLLFLLTLVLSFISVSQISFNGPQVLGPVYGGTFYPILQGSAGTFENEGYLVPQVTGVLSSVSIDADFIYSENSTYASDLSIVISRNANMLDSSNNILQVGGYNQLATNQIAWGCTGCSSSSVPIHMVANIDFPTPIDFTDTNFQIWIGNGYISTAAIGTWSINNLTFGGTNEFVATNDLTLDVKVYPNPTNESITISSATVIQNVTLYSILGDKLMELQLNDQKVELNLSQLEKGTYICKLASKEGASSTIRFVKN